MVAGFHLIWTAYGWWLPNDPRGSTSHEIRVEQIADLGELHHGRKPVQPLPRDLREFYERAGAVLKHDLLTFENPDVEVIAGSFRRAIVEQKYTCYACAIMHDHVHALIRKHKHHAEDMIKNLHDESRADLIAAGRRPAGHPVWGGPGWKVFLWTQADMVRTEKYIEGNPTKARQPAQKWDFVKPYDGWLPGGAKR